MPGFYGKYKSKRAYRRAVTKSTKGVRSYVGNAIKKRYFHKGGITQLAKDVSMLRGMINVEKKRYETNSQGLYAVGQVNANARGDLAFEVTPLPSQGSGYGSRNGASILFKSLWMEIQLNGQAIQNNQTRLKFMLVQSQTGDQFDISKFLNPNSFVYSANSVAIYDANCSRNPDHFRDYKVIKTKWVTIPPDQFSTGQAYCRQLQFKCKFGRGHHVRFDGNTNTPTNKRYFMVVLADCGNRSTTTASTLTGIPITAANTGTEVRTNSIAYFIDN